MYSKFFIGLSFNRVDDKSNFHHKFLILTIKTLLRKIKKILPKIKNISLNNILM